MFKTICSDNRLFLNHLLLSCFPSGAAGVIILILSQSIGKWYLVLIGLTNLLKRASRLNYISSLLPLPNNFTNVKLIELTPFCKLLRRLLFSCNLIDFKISLDIRLSTSTAVSFLTWLIQPFAKSVIMFVNPKNKSILLCGLTSSSLTNFSFASMTSFFSSWL